MYLFDIHPCLEDERNGVTKQYPYFKKGESPSDKFDSGFIIFPPGAIMPPKGQSVHSGYEISYVVSGSLTIHAGDEVLTYQGGNTIFIPAGVPHNCVNNGAEDCVVVYNIVEG